MAENIDARRDNLSKLYNTLVSEGFDGIGKDEEEFVGKMQKPENRKIVYDALSSNGYSGFGNDIKEFEDFIIDPNEVHVSRLAPSTPDQSERVIEQPTEPIVSKPIASEPNKAQQRLASIQAGHVVTDENGQERLVGFIPNIRQNNTVLAQGVRGMVGMAANEITGSSSDASAQLQEIARREEEGLPLDFTKKESLMDAYREALNNPNITDEERKDIAKQIRRTAISAAMPAMSKLMGFRVPGMKNNKIEQEVERKNELYADIQRRLEKNGGDIEKVKAELSEKLEPSWGDRQIAQASEVTEAALPSKGIAGFAGAMVPQMVGPALSIGLAYITKGKAPRLVSGMGALSMGGLSAATAGDSMMEAKRYGASDDQAWRIGMADAAIEYISEKIPIDLRYLKKLKVAGKSNVASSLEQAMASKEGNREFLTMLNEANKKLGGKFFSVNNAKEFGLDLFTEGSSEFLAEFAETITPIIYENPEDYPTLVEALNNGMEGFKGGLFMGGILGGASMAAGHRMNDQRRKNQGYVDAAYVNFGKPGEYEDVEIAEVVGRNEDGTYIVQRGDKIDSVDESQIYDNARFTYDEFKRNEIEFTQDMGFDEGYNLKNPTEMAKATKKFEAYRARVAGQLGVSEEELDRMDAGLETEKTADFNFRQTVLGVERGLKDTGEALDPFIDKQYETYLNYVRARASYNGMINAAQDKISKLTEEMAKTVDSRVNQDTGNIQPIILKPVSGQTEGRQAYIVKGNLALNDDGAINKAASGDIFIISADGQEPRMISAEEIERALPLIDPEREKAEGADNIANTIATETDDAMSGRLRLNVGESFTLQDGRTGEILQNDGQNLLVGVMGADGKVEQIPVLIESLQSAVDAQALADANAEIDAEQVEEEVKQIVADHGDYKTNESIVVDLGDGTPRAAVVSPSEEPGMYEVLFDEATPDGDRLRLMSKEDLDSVVRVREGREITPIAPAEQTTTAETQEPEVKEAATVTEEELAEKDKIASAQGMPFKVGDKEYTLYSIENLYRNDNGELMTTIMHEDDMDEVSVPFSSLRAAYEDYVAPKDFRGNKLPVMEDGSVDEGKLFASDPEAWARWNDSERKDGGTNSTKFISKHAQNVQKSIDKLTKQYEDELDFGKRKELEGRIAEQQKQLDAFNKIIAAYKTKETDLIEPKSLSQLVASAMKQMYKNGSLKNGISRESFKAETGYGEQEARGFNPILGKDGMTIETLAERIAGDYAESGLIPMAENGSPDIQSVRNEIIGLLSSNTKPSELFGYTRAENLAESEELFSKLKEENPTDAKAEVVKRAAKLATVYGTKIQFLTSVDQIQNAQAADRIMLGQRIRGWYDNTGKAYIFLPAIGSAKELNQVVTHEALAHMGLKALMGGKKYRQFCNDVYRNMMTAAERHYFFDVYNEGKKSEAAAADEYLAHMSQAIDITPTEEKSFWGKVLDKVKSIIGKSEDVDLTYGDDYLTKLLKASYANIIRDVNIAESYRATRNYIANFATDIPESIAQAEAEVEQNPTEAQKEAGNYKKGHLKLDGFDISIENPKGSIRSGVDKDGKRWETKMNNTYGYIRGRKTVDGDDIDIFLSDNPTDGNVFVVDQVNPKTGEFDEHKVMYGFNSVEEAKQAYLSNYEEGWQGLGNITEVSKDDFKKWVESSRRKTKPFAEYAGTKVVESSEELRPSKVTKEMDEEYLSAVKDGDMEKAQKMVADAFKMAFPNTKVVDENGRPKVMYHGTRTYGFTEFSQPGDEWNDGMIWTSDDQTISNLYDYQNDYDEGEDIPPHGTYKLYVDAENLFELGDIEKNTSDLEFATIAEKLEMTPESLLEECGFDSKYDDNIFEVTRTGKFANILKSKGYDGASAKEYGGKYNTIGVVNNTQVKSADPVTYDGNGDVIPLSQRFNPENEDIRFSKVGAREEITYDNFFQHTKATFEKVEKPEGKPDHISYKFDPYAKDRVSSVYWYGKDDGGEYVVRGSNHWSYDYPVTETHGHSKRSGHRTSMIGTCDWKINIPVDEWAGKKVHGKSYLNDFVDINPSVNIQVDDVDNALAFTTGRNAEEIHKERVEILDSNINKQVGGQIQLEDDESAPVRFSIVAMAQGAGFEPIENDGNNNFAIRIGDKIFDHKHHVTGKDIEQHANCTLNYLINASLALNNINEKKAKQIRDKYASLLNSILDKGVARDGISGYDFLSSQWQYVAETVYKTVATNGDKQYSFSLDITRVCKKNEAVIKAIASMQRQLGYGATPGQIMDIYLSSIEEGYQVPCPVCYVFSRYINNGKYATVAILGQKKYGDKLVDPSTLSEAEKKEKIDYWLNELNKQQKANKKYSKAITKAQNITTRNYDLIDKLTKEITSGKLSEDEKKAKIEQVHKLDAEYKAALDLVSQSRLDKWIKQFAIRKTKNGWELWNDTFQGFPEENALDLRLTADTMRNYPAIQRLRNSIGSAGGKEITFEANNDLGEVALMLGKSNLRNVKNYFKMAAEAQTEKERAEYLDKANKEFAKSSLYAHRQTLRGGQRMWSWSDNIERLAPDVAINLIQMELLGGALQSYSKQLEGINLVARMNGYVNGSLMGKGGGYVELTSDKVGELDGKLIYTGEDMVEVDAKGVSHILTKTGAPVFESNGKYYTLVFDDVVGIDAFGKDIDGKHLKGLFELNQELDKAGNILVGMNDNHIRTALADDRIYFVIPWHASGNSIHILNLMFEYLTVDTDFEKQDYTAVQEEKYADPTKTTKKDSEEDKDDLDKEEEVKILGAFTKVNGKKVINPYLIELWEKVKNETEFKCGIEGGIPSGKDGDLSAEQRAYKRLRDGILTGEKMSKRDLVIIANDEFLSQVKRRVDEATGREAMTKSDTDFIYPYEYWDETTTYETADKNTERYLEYCRRLGYKPKFSGKLDGKQEKDFGNFTGDKGYWKLLIDRRMYDVNGKYQWLDPVNSEDFEPEYTDPEWTEQQFVKTVVADDPGAERVAQRAIEKEEKRPGGVAQVHYEKTLDEAADDFEKTMLSKVYHGSGAEFDKFDEKFMSTGEGNQAYGWGTYVTTNKDTGIRYAEIGAGNKLDENAEKVKYVGDNSFGLEDGAAESAAKYVAEFGLTEARKMYQQMIDDLGGVPRSKFESDVKFLLDISSEKDFTDARVGNRHLYEVEIPDDNGFNYLHWDEPMTMKQAKAIQDEIVKQYGGQLKETCGDDYMREIKSAIGYGTVGAHVEGGLNYLLGNEMDYATGIDRGAKRNAKLLSDAGIVGMEVAVDRRNGSRYAGSNYVIYDNDNADITGHTAFSKINANQEMFVSNAQMAVESLNIGKATGEQWLKAIQGRGGLKAGEDKWLGLSQWLGEKSNPIDETITFNDLEGKKIVGYRYGKAPESGYSYNTREKKTEPGVSMASVGYNEEKGSFAADSNNGEGIFYYEGEIAKETGGDDEICLTNVREISRDEYQKSLTRYTQTSNDIANAYFNRASNLAAKGWRIDIEREKAKRDKALKPIERNFTREEILKFIEENRIKIEETKYGIGFGASAINPTRLEYTTSGLEKKREIALTVPAIESWNENDQIHFGDAGQGRAVAWVRFGETYLENDDRIEYERRRTELNDFIDSMTKKYGTEDYGEQMYAMSEEEISKYEELSEAVDKAYENARNNSDYRTVLVIDEIQSKRHQEGREKGYRDEVSEEDKKIFDEFVDISSKITDAELAGDKESWNKWFSERTQLYKKYGIERVNEARRNVRESKKNPAPAPFEKNWQELAMKRMLRLAAEEGYDMIAWTNGNMQARRYSLSEKIDDFYYKSNGDGTYKVSAIANVTRGRGDGRYDDYKEFKYDSIPESELSQYFGNDVASQIIAGKGRKNYQHNQESGWTTFKGNELELGGEGMKGFYDEILPRFMDKYGKKWGVKTQDIELPVGKGMWHSVDVTPEMKESVMEGQTMFSIIGPKGALRLADYRGSRAEEIRNGKIAIKMEKEGKTPKEIKLATGWERGKDKRWRYELPDFKLKDAKIFTTAKSWPRLEEVIGAKELFAAYPELRDYKVGYYEKGARLNGRKGAFSPELKQIVLSWDQLAKMRRPATRQEKIDYGYDPDALANWVDFKLNGEGRKTLIHEIQHAIQHIEGFANGTNADAKKISIDQAYKNANKLLREVNRLKDLAKDSDEYQRYIQIKNGEEDGNLDEAKKLAFGTDKMKDYQEKRKEFILLYGIDPKEYDFTEEQEKRALLEERLPMAEYHRSAGEVEARNAEKRADWNKEDRANTTFEESEDVPRELQEVAFSKVTDPEVLKWFDEQPKEVWYGSMTLLNPEETDKSKWRFAPVKSAKDSSGKMREASALGQLERSDEDLEGLKKGKYDLKDVDNDTVGGVNYNPYFHLSDSLMNDQFTGAYNKPNTVVVKFLVPKSELYPEGEAYKAEGANNSVGVLPWHSGIINAQLPKDKQRRVALSRWRMPIDVVSNEEVAKYIAKKLKEANASMPWNLVTPGVLEELDKLGAPITEGVGSAKMKGVPRPEIRLSKLSTNKLHDIADKVSGSKYDQFAMSIFNNNEEVRKQMVDMARGMEWNFLNASKKYLADLADVWEPTTAQQNIYDEARKIFGDNLSDNEVRYMLWKKGDHEKGAFGVAEDILMQKELGVGDFAKEDSEQIMSKDDMEDDIRFSKARDIYEEKNRIINKEGEKTSTANLFERLHEAYLDSMKSLKDAQDAVAEESGKPIKDFENAYMAENAMSSKNKAAVDEFELNYKKPLLDQIEKLYRAGVPHEEIVSYLMAKHGLERNQIMQSRNEAKLRDELNEKIKNIKDNASDRAERIAELNERYDDLIDKTHRDYAGLTELTGDANAYNELARDIVARFESAHDAKDLWSAINRATKRILRESYNAGMMTAEQFNDISSMYQYYIPLRGWDSDVARDVYDYLQSSTPIRENTLKNAKGRTSLADDPIATIQKMAYDAIAQANRNLMKQKFLNMVMNHPTDLFTVSEQWYTKNAATGEWEPKGPDFESNDSAEAIRRKVKEFEEKMRLAEAEGNAKRQRGKLNLGKHATPPEKREHEVHVFRGGKEYVVYVNGNPRVAQALNGWTNPSSDNTKVEEGMQAVKNFMAMAFTSKNPAFIFANLARDTMFAEMAVYAKESPAYRKQYNNNYARNIKTMMGLISKLQNGTLDNNIPIERYFREFIASGGETGYTNVVNVDTYKKELARFEKELQREGIEKAAMAPKEILKSIGGGIEYLNRTAEDITRFAVYMTSRQMGRSVARSVWDAKNITVNFNKKGSGEYGSKYANFAYIFFNACVQSAANITRIVKNNPKKSATALTGFLTAGMLQPILILAAQAMLGYGDDDDEMSYWDLPEWVRRNNLVFWVPGTNGYITIPMSQELRPLFGIGEIAASTMFGKETVEEGIKKGAEGLTTLMPVDVTGNGGNQIINFMPTVVQPVVQLVFNKDFFGAPIWKRNDFNKDNPAWTKAYKGTAGWLVDGTRWLNEVTGGNDVDKGGINLNPAIIEHLFEGYLGGAGKTFNRTLKTISMLWRDDQRMMRNVPVLSGFVKTVDERNNGSQIGREYYDLLDEYNEAQHKYSGYIAQLKREGGIRAEEYAKRIDEYTKSKEYQRYLVMKEFVKQIDKLNGQKKNLPQDMADKIDKEVLEIKKRMISAMKEDNK